MHEIGTPDYALIKSEIQNKDSQWYYPVLMERAMSLDTNLTMHDFHFLYYGYIFSDYYMYVDPLTYKDEVMLYLKTKDITSNEYQAVLVLLNKARREFPFDKGKVELIINLYRKLNNNEKADMLSKQMEAVIKVMLLSGDGKTKETAIHVISVPHEYSLINILGYTKKKQYLLENKYDVIEGLDSKGNHANIYFNIEQLMLKTQSIFK